MRIVWVFSIDFLQKPSIGDSKLLLDVSMRVKGVCVWPVMDCRPAQDVFTGDKLQQTKAGKIMDGY